MKYFIDQITGVLNMRKVTNTEMEKISGGVTDLPPVIVTAPAPPNDGPIPGGTGGGGPHNPPSSSEGLPKRGGGDGSITISESHIFKGFAEELQALALDGEVPSDWIETGVDIADMSASYLSADYNGGLESWTIYHDTGFSPNPGTSYADAPINWNKVDWSEIPGIDSATTYDQALNDLVSYGQSH